MMKSLITISILTLQLLVFGPVLAQDIRCVEVLPNGDISLTWTAYDNSAADFASYQVERKLSTQPDSDFAIFVGGNIVNANTFSTIDNNIDGTVNEYCYRVRVLKNNGSAAIAYASLCSMLIDVQNATTPGKLDITWNDPAPDPLTIPPGSMYTVLYEHPLGNWNTGSSFPYSPGLGFYEYEIVTCNDFVNYQLTLQMPGEACASASNIVGLIVDDISSPLTPEIFAVGVDSLTGNALIDWVPVSAPDIAGYVIYECDPIFGDDDIHVIYDPLVTEWIYPGSDASTIPESFLVAAFDECITGTGPPNTGNLSPSQTNDDGTTCPSIYESMFLTTEWTSCQNYVDLEWNPYIGWGEDNVIYYEVYRRTDNGPDEFLDLVEAEENTYRDNTIGDTAEYSYYVKAYSGSVNSFATSISNIQIQEVSTPELPVTFSLASASVNLNQEVEITVNTAPTATVFDYALQRKKESDPFFRNLETQTPLDIATLTEVTFTDTDVETDVRSYLYRVALINVCNDTVAFSNIGKTILLDGIFNDEDLINTISWTPYLDWENGVESYDIYRSVDGAPFAYLTTNNGDIRFLEDDVTTELKSEGNFCYRVVASESNNSLGLNAESQSNKFCLSQPPKIWIPNAFAINGINNRFGPVVSFADRDTYEMIIYNRWGQEIWQTNDLDIGWDGRVEGNLLPEGNYMYYIGIRNGEGKLFEFRGPLTLLIFDAN
ncbi:MAG: gliding motility-associated C-terminal domain-containing protein [Flavobacteriales bacterium]